jgi:hypothetical protein
MKIVDHVAWVPEVYLFAIIAFMDWLIQKGEAALLQ